MVAPRGGRLCELQRCVTPQVLPKDHAPSVLCGPLPRDRHRWWLRVAVPARGILESSKPCARCGVKGSFPRIASRSLLITPEQEGGDVDPCDGSELDTASKFAARGMDSAASARLCHQVVDHGDIEQEDIDR